MYRILGLLVIFLSSFSLVRALTSEEKQTIEDLIDPPLQNYIDQTLEMDDPLAQLQEKIEEIQDELDNEDLENEFTIYGLEYVLQTLDDIIDTILVELQEEEEEEEIEEEEQEPKITIDVSDYEDGEKSIIAGKESPPIIELEYTAQYEDILITELEIAGGGDMWNFIEMVRIYSETGVLLGEYIPLSDGYTMKDVNMYIPEGTQKFYVTLQPYKIGKESVGEQKTRSYTFDVVEAIGQTTNEEIESFGSVQTTDDINFLPVKIAEVEFLDEAFGYEVVDQLSDGEDQNLAILSITADTWENTFSNSTKILGLTLDSITFSIEETVDNMVSNTLTLQRIDSGSDDELTVFSAHSASAGFNLTDAKESIYLLESGETAVFLLRGDIELSDGLNSVKILLEDLDDGAITYTSEDPGSKVIRELHFDYDKIESSKISG